MHRFLAIGAPLMDYILWVPEEYLQKIKGAKGGMEPVSQQEFLSLMQSSEQMPTLAAGGSQANTLKGLAHFGHECTFVGMVGEDSQGQEYQNIMQKVGIQCCFQKEKNVTTGGVLCLVTPDGDRTMRTFLGASAKFDASMLKEQHFENIDLVHLSAYSFYEESVVEKTIALAKKAHAKVSLSLASFEVVQQFRPLIESLLLEGVDFVFGNNQEAEALCGLQEKKAALKLAEHVECAVVHDGANGAWAAKNGAFEYMPAFEALEVKDSTGAGDCFTAGFLHAYFEGLSLNKTLRLANACGAATVQVIGAELPKKVWTQLVEDPDLMALKT